MSLYSFNKVFLIGRLGQAPEKQISSNGTVSCSFSVAVSQSYKDKNEQWQEKTTWLYVTAFSNVAEQCFKYLQKGSLAHIEGSIDTFEREKNGEKYTTYKIKAFQVKPLDYRKPDIILAEKAPTTPENPTDSAVAETAPIEKAESTPTEKAETTITKNADIKPEPTPPAPKPAEPVATPESAPKPKPTLAPEPKPVSVEKTENASYTTFRMDLPLTD